MWGRSVLERTNTVKALLGTIFMTGIQHFEQFCELLTKLGHTLVESEYGGIDHFALDENNHNGPGCSRCGRTWCWHCEVRKIRKGEYLPDRCDDK